MRQRPRQTPKQRKSSIAGRTDVVYEIEKPTLVVLQNVLFALFMSPLLAIGGFAFHWGVDNCWRQRMPWLWSIPPLIVGAALIGLWFHVMWRQCIWLPSITISRFHLTDHGLTICTSRLGELEVRVNDVVRCYRQHSNTGTAGWWILLKKHRWIYLRNDLTKAPILAERFRGKSTN